MKALIVDNVILYKNEGDYYAPTIYDNKFFDRYLSVFSEIRIVAKVFPANNVQLSNFIRINTNSLEIIELPPYRGLQQMLKNIFRIRRVFQNIEDGCDCSILKVVQVESIFAILFGHLRRPYGVEVVNDPQTFTPGFSLIKFVSVQAMYYFMRHAKGVSYITKRVLQNKYPCYGMTEKGKKKGYFYTDYPTIDLYVEDNVRTRVYPEKMSKIKLLHVANVIESDAKGQSTVIKIIEKLKKHHIEAKVFFLGEGGYVEELRRLAKTLNVEDSVCFVGRVASHEEVINYYKTCDLFVFPSRSEGQGRVNLEAQSVGLPCLASKVGGIVELFDEDYLFDPDDVEGFSNKIVYLCNNTKELSEMSKKNIESARRFEYSKAKSKRESFYKELQQLARK